MKNIENIENIENMVNDINIGQFNIGTVYYFMDAQISEFTKNPRPDIKLIHYVEEFAFFNIDSLGFSELYPQFWFDINTLGDYKYPYQNIRSMTILNFNKNLRMASYKILETTKYTYSLTSKSAVKYSIDSNGKVRAEKYKDFFNGYLLETIEITRYDVENLMHTFRIVKDN